MPTLKSATSTIESGDVDGELARNLAGCRAAHAVAHREDRALIADRGGSVRLEETARAAREVGDEEVVLVVLADLSDVRACEELDAHLARRGRRVAFGRRRCRFGRL
jgi:hypothetical protein